MEVNAELIEHMMNPQNYGTLENANAQGIGKNPQNGEKVIIHLHVKEQEGEPTIEDIRFQAIGCTTTIVAGSIITTEAKGVTFQKAEDIITFTMQMLDSVPPEEAACSEMVAIALKAAMDTYFERQKDPEYPLLSYQIQNSCELPSEEEEV